MKPRRVVDLLMSDASYVNEDEPLRYWTLRRLVGPSKAMQYKGYLVRPYSDGRPRNVWAVRTDAQNTGAEDMAEPVLKNGRPVY